MRWLLVRRIIPKEILRAFLRWHQRRVRWTVTTLGRYWAAFLTAGYLFFITSLRGRDAWRIVLDGNLNELGDFLAGVLTPVALFWLIYGYYLQREELGLQRKELKKTGDALTKQTEIAEKRLGEELQQKRPIFDLVEERDIQVEPFRFFSLHNKGGIARHVQIAYGLKNTIVKTMTESKVEPGWKISFMIEGMNLSSIYFCEIDFRSDSQESWHQGWEMEIVVGDAYLEMEIRDKSYGPVKVRTTKGTGAH